MDYRIAYLQVHCVNAPASLGTSDGGMPEDFIQTLDDMNNVFNVTESEEADVMESALKMLEDLRNVKGIECDASVVKDNVIIAANYPHWYPNLSYLTPMPPQFALLLPYAMGWLEEEPELSEELRTNILANRNKSKRSETEEAVIRELIEDYLLEGMDRNSEEYRRNNEGLEKSASIIRNWVIGGEPIKSQSV